MTDTQPFPDAIRFLADETIRRIEAGETGGSRDFPGTSIGVYFDDDQGHRWHACLWTENDTEKRESYRRLDNTPEEWGTWSEPK